MSRQIKFRIWDTKTNKNVTNALTTPQNEVYYPTISVIGGVYFDRMEGGELICLNDNEDCEGRFVLQEFTGLLDKNIQEAYEGDIVELYSCGSPIFRSAVTFEIGVFGVADKRGGVVPVFRNLSYYEQFRVIGNIFENSELL